MGNKLPTSTGELIPDFFLNHQQYAYMIQPLEIRDWTLENGRVNEAAKQGAACLVFKIMK